MAAWEAFDQLPSEAIPAGVKTAEPIRYGHSRWRDLFGPRQIIGHATSVEIYQTMLAESEANGLSELTKAAFVYLALSLDKMLNYNSRMSVWMSVREVTANTFNRHDFAFCWSHAEMTPLVAGVGFDWAIEQTAKCIDELSDLVGSTTDLISLTKSRNDVALSVTCRSGEDLQHVPDASVDVVVMDPPYYDNVMYAELSDYFYVWLKRTAGHVVPEIF
ncbi:hypothetical protein ACRBEV_25605 [Methylobacterium phyllosphaerae]